MKFKKKNKRNVLDYEFFEIGFVLFKNKIKKR